MAVWRDWVRGAGVPLIGLLLRLAGGREALSLRLRRAGRSDDPAAYLWQQMAWGCFGGILAVGAVSLVVGPSSPAESLVILIVGLVGGVLSRDWWLGREVAGRRAIVDEQLPVAAELLALCLAGGFSPLQSLTHVGNGIGGPLGERWLETVADVEAGERFSAGMRRAADDLDHAAHSRFADSLVAAIERGSPLAEVARAQALDARVDGHRRLMEAAGRKDISMLVPIVFLLLPLVVVIALFPGAMDLGLLG